MSNSLLIQLFPSGTYNGTYVLSPNDASGGSPVSGQLSTTMIVSVLPGVYNLSVTADGYLTQALRVDTTLSDEVTVHMSNIDDEDSVGLPAGQAPANTIAAPVFTPLKRNNPEFVSPNSDYGKYFMSTDARIYVGNVFLDEVDSVQFILQSNQIPVYAYRSSLFAAVGQGRGIVQGQIAINFISEGYLYSVLDNYNNQDVDPDPIQVELNNLQVAKLGFIGNETSVVAGSSTTTLAQAQAANQLQLNNINQRITALVATKGQDGAKALETSIAYASNEQARDNTFCNAVYQAGPFDIVANFSSGGRTVTRKLESCFLISNEQQVSRDGKIVMDLYGFIARRLR